MELEIKRLEQGQTRNHDEQSLGFGTHFTDHMFRMDYSPEQGWHGAQICPRQPLSLDPASMVLHYGQAVFVGLKAYKRPDGDLQLFRPEANFARLNRSCRRLDIPTVDEAFCLEALEQLLRIDAAWAPESLGTSLYIRPFIIATDAQLGVRASQHYSLLILLSPSGLYYKDGLKPVSIYVEDHYVRAARGGIGEAKTAGNYAASILAQSEAARRGCEQVLWLDAQERRYIEEVGAMNVFFVSRDRVLSPALSGSILAGITRDSVLQILADWGIEVEERALDIEEVMDGIASGEISEAFGSGTAAIISPIGQLRWKGRDYLLSEGQIGPLSQRLFEELSAIQYGLKEDPHDWTRRIRLETAGGGA